MLRQNKNTAIRLLYQKPMLIAVQMLFGDGLALSVCFADTSPREGEAFRTMNREEVYSTLII